jgi:hypothetical protein
MGGYGGTHRQGRDGLRYLGRSALGRHRHGGDKAIPVTIPRLNAALRLPGVADGAAYGLETVVNCGITDCRGRPYLFTEFMLGNHTVAVHQEIGEHLEHFRSQSNRLASPAQEIALCVQDTVRKEVVHSLALLAF